MLDKLEVKNNRVDYYFTSTTGLKKYFNCNKMFVEYDVDISDIPTSILVIPFVANILPLMWLTNSIMWVTNIDRTFYDAIPKIKYAYQELCPHYELRGAIVSAYTTKNIYMPEKEAILLFSGGLDSNATFIRINDKKPILVNIQGFYEPEITYNKVYDTDKQDITKFALTQGVQANFVRSNFGTIINNTTFNKNILKKLKTSYWFGFQHAMGFLSVVSLLAFKCKVKKIYIASSNTMGFRELIASDPTTDIQFKFATAGEVIHDGYDLTRQNKVKIIADFQKKMNTHYHLRVCSFNDKNCCACEKCFRTILGFAAEGADISNFSFNIEEDLATHFQNKMDLMMLDFPDPDYIEKSFYSDIKQRIIKNRYNIAENAFVNWFLEYDVKKNREKAILKYRVRNLIPIIKRRITNI